MRIEGNMKIRACSKEEGGREQESELVMDTRSRKEAQQSRGRENESGKNTES